MNSFEKAQLSIIEDGEEYALQQMEEVYEKHADEERKINKLLAGLFIAYSINGIINLKNSERNQANKRIDKTLLVIGETLGTHETKVVTDILKEGYLSTYYLNQSLLTGGFKVNYNLQRKEFIDSIINLEFKGERYSDRIWKNKGDMIDKLQRELDLCLRGQSTIDQSSKRIRETFNVTAYQSDRLMITELSRCQSQAQIDIARNEGYEELIWSATLEKNCCSRCRELDHTVWNINYSMPDQPQHPRCRCCWLIKTDSLKFTTRKDNETKKLIDHKNFMEWSKDNNIL